MFGVLRQLWLIQQLRRRTWTNVLLLTCISRWTRGSCRSQYLVLQGYRQTCGTCTFLKITSCVQHKNIVHDFGLTLYLQLGSWQHREEAWPHTQLFLKQTYFGNYYKFQSRRGYRREAGLAWIVSQPSSISRFLRLPSTFTNVQSAQRETPRGQDKSLSHYRD